MTTPARGHRSDVVAVDTETLDRLTREITAFASFADMVENTLSTYRPTLRVDTADALLLADAYDAAQERRGDARRAYRTHIPTAPAAGPAEDSSVHLRLMRSPDGSGIPGEWLELIWAANKITEERGEERIFGEPTFLGDWWAGGEVEEYPDARVIFRSDSRTTSIVSKTARGAELLRAAAEARGIHLP